MPVGFEPCHSSGGFISQRRAEQRSAVTTSEELNRLQNAPAFQRWVIERKGPPEGTYLTGLLLIGVVLMMGVVIGIGMGVGIEKPGSEVKTETPIPEAQPAVAQPAVVQPPVAPPREDEAEVVEDESVGLKARVMELEESKEEWAITERNLVGVNLVLQERIKVLEGHMVTPVQPHRMNHTLGGAIKEEIPRVRSVHRSLQYLPWSLVAILLLTAWKLKTLLARERVYATDTIEQLQQENASIKTERDESLSLVEEGLPETAEMRTAEEIFEEVRRAKALISALPEKMSELELIKKEMQDLEAEHGSLASIDISLKERRNNLGRLMSAKQKLMKTEKEFEELTSLTQAMKPLDELEKEVALLEKEYNHLQGKKEKCILLQRQLAGAPEVYENHKKMEQELSDVERKKKRIEEIEETLKLYDLQHTDEIEMEKNLEEKIAVIEQLTQKNKEMEERIPLLQGLVEEKEHLEKSIAKYENVEDKVKELQEAVMDHFRLECKHRDLKKKAALVAKYEEEIRDLEYKADELGFLRRQSDSLKENVLHEQKLLDMHIEYQAHIDRSVVAIDTEIDDICLDSSSRRAQEEMGRENCGVMLTYEKLKAQKSLAVAERNYSNLKCTLQLEMEEILGIPSGQYKPSLEKPVVEQRSTGSQTHMETGASKSTSDKQDQQVASHSEVTWTSRDQMELIAAELNIEEFLFKTFNQTGRSAHQLDVLPDYRKGLAANCALRERAADTERMNGENGSLLADNPATDVTKLLSFSDNYGNISESADKVDISQEAERNLHTNPDGADMPNVMPEEQASTQALDVWDEFAVDNALKALEDEDDCLDEGTEPVRVAQAPNPSNGRRAQSPTLSVIREGTDESLTLETSLSSSEGDSQTLS